MLLFGARATGGASFGDSVCATAFVRLSAINYSDAVFVLSREFFFCIIAVWN